MIFTPYYVGFKDQGYNQLRVISLLGDVNSPVRENFNRLTIIAGMLMLASLPRYMLFFPENEKRCLVSSGNDWRLWFI